MSTCVKVHCPSRAAVDPTMMTYLFGIQSVNWLIDDVSSGIDLDRHQTPPSIPGIEIPDVNPSAPSARRPPIPSQGFPRVLSRCPRRTLMFSKPSKFPRDKGLFPIDPAVKKRPKKCAHFVCNKFRTYTYTYPVLFDLIGLVGEVTDPQGSAGDMDGQRQSLRLSTTMDFFGKSDRTISSTPALK